MNLCRVVLLCIVCIHQVRGREEYITGYSGQSVILKSGADRSWNLTRVQWSIYKNTTYIAGLKDGDVVLYNFWRHQGRLGINNETGDLTIRNVTVNDSLTYNVALATSDGGRKQAKVHLTVQESLKTPDIQIQMLYSLNDSHCYIALECTAFGQNVNLTWAPDGKFSGSYISGIPNSVVSSLVLFASFSGNRNVTFNCNASSGQQTVTRQMRVGCSEEQQKYEVCTACSSCASAVLWSILFTAAVVLLSVYAIIKNKGRILDAWSKSPCNFIQNSTTSFSPGSRGVQRKQTAA
ncbi:CD48 antigen [Onychostoma macrolepis]|uniref:Ig-like domain-containing protein n=1 Tax=Onychostoma macrolepis TaxID=369639 RepID=A0A7J6CWI5_9TELE|nr:CD48 antigen [Onychostoma macrolepis]KAF4111630.1 hypothetical protein G5714_008661 [Onychostoma macrolepis]